MKTELTNLKVFWTLSRLDCTNSKAFQPILTRYTAGFFVGGSADVSTNVVFISPQADLTEWDTRTVDVTPSGPVSGPTLEVAPDNPSQGRDERSGGTAE